MAQHPAKLKWREERPYGLSASQFGMALGFCGRVVDYVDYLRNVVGSELEFTGNASTSHGIATEPKSRALYELLTGTAVSDGGFFLTDDQLLGCSPDGRVFYDANATSFDVGSASASSTELTSSPDVVSVRIPFRSKRKVQPNGSASLEDNAPQQRCRLLEIKSPFYSLYDGSKPAYQPFGIPLHYLCQVQGQMSIAGVDECDFFVCVDGRPACQVVAWRVRRSGEFWAWAQPKLLRVAEWVRNGPPSWLNRRFEFEAFDFSKIDVQPLIFPYDITRNMPIDDPRRFPFFEKFPNPYRDATGVDRQQDGILRGLTSAVTRFIFHADVDGELDESDDESDVLWCAPLAAAPAWNSLASVSDAAVCEALAMVRPRDFNINEVTCRVHSTMCDPMGGSNSSNESGSTLRVRYSQRDFFHSLEPLLSPVTATALGAHGALPAAASKNATQPSRSSLFDQALFVPERREISIHSTDSVIIIDEAVSVAPAESDGYYILSQ